MGRRAPALLFVCCTVVALAAPAPHARAAIVTGSVIGPGARPVAGARVEVLRAELPCETRTAADGTFSLPCAATGVHAVRASHDDLHPWEVGAVMLSTDGEVHLNFMLMPVSASALDTTAAEPPAGFWTRRVPNPVLTTWQEHPITLRVLAMVVAALSFPLGALTMVALGRRFGIETRRLSAGEVGEMVLNPMMPPAGEHVTPIATVGARGASATISFGADEIAAALAERRYGLVFMALVVAPALFAAFSLGLGVAILIGQEVYLLCAMLVVPAGFLLTAIMIGIQAFAHRKSG